MGGGLLATSRPIGSTTYGPRGRLRRVGLVVWDHYSGPLRERLGLYVVAAPSIELRLVPPQYLETERARRNAIYEAGGEQQLRAHQAKEAQREARKAAEANLPRPRKELGQRDWPR